MEAIGLVFHQCSDSAETTNRSFVKSDRHIPILYHHILAGDNDSTDSVHRHSIGSHFEQVICASVRHEHSIRPCPDWTWEHFVRHIGVEIQDDRDADKSPHGRYGALLS